MDRVRGILLFISLSTLNAQVLASDTYDAWMFYMDNDVLSDYFCKQWLDCAENEDRNYTGGFGIGLKVNKSFRAKPGLRTWQAGVHDWLTGRDEPSGDEILNETLGFTAFTPENLTTPDPIDGDRPFASQWFYTSTLAAPVKDRPSHARRSQLSLHLIGADIGRDLQTFVHCELGKGACPVAGWRNNINDGHDLAVSFGSSYLYRLYSPANEGQELIGDIGYSLGLYNEINLGLTYRFGDLATPFYAVETDPFFAGNKFINLAVRDNFGWLSVRTHLVLYNSLLQGWHLFSDPGPVRYNGDEIERVLLSWSVGWTFPVPCTESSALTIKVQGRSPEIDSELAEDHAWGGLYFTQYLN